MYEPYANFSHPRTLSTPNQFTPRQHGSDPTYLCHLRKVLGGDAVWQHEGSNVVRSVLVYILNGFAAVRFENFVQLGNCSHGWPYNNWRHRRVKHTRGFRRV